MSKVQLLLKEIMIGVLTLKNRIVMAPMTRSRANKLVWKLNLHLEKVFIYLLHFSVVWLSWGYLSCFKSAQIIQEFPKSIDPPTN